MPNESVNLYLSIQSGSSEQTLVSLSDKTRALDKDTQLLKQATDALAKASGPLMEEQTKLQAQLKLSQKTVNDLQKVYDQYGDEMMKLNLDEAIENHAKLKAELAAVNAQIGTNQKTYKEYLETVRKGGLSNPSPASLGGGDSGLNAVNVLAALGIGEKLSSLAQEAGGALLNSALGSDMGGLASGVLSSTLAGAAAGSIIPGIVTAVGAGVGALSGLISGGTKIFEAQDDAFKDYYGGLYDDVKGRSGEMVETGTSLASTRETNRISFTTLFDGDEDRARSYLEDLIDMANSTPFLYDDLVSMSKTLATYGYDDSNILPLLYTIGDAGAALGMGTSDMNSVAQALGRMKSSDKATLEYLNILNDRGIGAIGYLAEAKGKSIGETYDMISRGKITGTEAVEIITAALSRDKEDGGYKGSMEEQSQTFAGISSTLEGLQQNLNALGGEGYNTLRQKGKDAEVNSLKGDLGDAIGEINRIIGKNQAMKENLQEQYMREVKAMVMEGEKGELWDKLDAKQQDTLTEMSQQYAEWMARYKESGETDWEAAVELQKLYEVTEATGQAYFDNSEFMKTLTDKEIDEIQAILDNTAALDNATKASYEVAQALSKGRGNAFFKAIWGETITEGKGGDVSFSTAASNYLGAPTQKEDSYTTYSGLRVPYSHAFGLERVPYNEYPALLHRDERVLTASEARAQDAGQGTPVPIQIPITGNIFTGMPEEIADQIAEIIVRKLEQAAVAAAPK